MSPAAADRWEYVRHQGRGKFVWMKGVLLWGAATGLCATVFAAGAAGPDKLAVIAPAAAILCPVAGYFYGRWVWDLNETAYHEARGLADKKDDAPAQPAA